MGKLFRDSSMTGSTWSTYFILPNNPFEKYEGNMQKMRNHGKMAENELEGNCKDHRDSQLILISETWTL